MEENLIPLRGAYSDAPVDPAMQRVTPLQPEGCLLTRSFVPPSLGSITGRRKTKQQQTNIKKE
jgi:hypothetical protein